MPGNERFHLMQRRPRQARAGTREATTARYISGGAFRPPSVVLRRSGLAPVELARPPKLPPHPGPLGQRSTAFRKPGRGKLALEMSRLHAEEGCTGAGGAVGIVRPKMVRERRKEPVSANEKKRRRPDSNRRMADLQSAALPLGYGAPWLSVILSAAARSDERHGAAR